MLAPGQSTFNFYLHQPALACALADAGDRKSQKVTADTPTVAIKEQPSQAKLPPFQAFEVSTGKTVRHSSPAYRCAMLCHVPVQYVVWLTQGP